MKSIHHVFFFFISCLSYVVILAQELPPVINYSSAQYQGGNQNWMISQSSERQIFIANTKGLLQFNGARWKLYPEPNESIIRSVRAIDDRIYTGSYMNFGYWEHNPLGELQYVSLIESLDIPIIEDEQFWNIIAHYKWIIFQSLDRIIIFNTENNSIQIIDSEGIISKLFRVKNEIYFHVLGEGIYVIEDGKKQLLSNHQVVLENRVIGLFSITNELVLITEEAGFYKLNGALVNRWDTTANRVLDGMSIYCAIQLKNEDIALGSIAHGVLIISKQGEIRHRFDRSNGLGNNTVLSLFPDADNNVWVGLDNGVDCINITTPFQNYVDQNGILGTIYASASFEGMLYLGTNQGLFYKPISDETEFKIVPGTETQVWSLDVIDEQLFCGHNMGTFQIVDGQAKLINTVPGTWSVKKVPENSELLLQGNYQGLHTLIKNNGRWEPGNKLEGFDFSAKHFEIVDAKTILVSHEYRGVYKLKVDIPGGEVNSFEKLNSVNKGVNSGLVQFEGDILYANKEGVYTYDSETSEFVRNDVLSSVFENGEYTSGKMVSDNHGGLWAFTKNYLYYVNKEKLESSYRIRPLSIPQESRSEMEGYENISFFQDGTYVYGASNGYLLIDPSFEQTFSFDIRIDEILVTSYTEEPTKIAHNRSKSLHSKENNLQFKYSVPVYEKYLNTKYQYKLIGKNSDWSRWTDESQVSFENLKHGTYEFLVRAKINNKLTSNEAGFRFEIEKPWFLTSWVIFTYVLIGLVLLLVVNWLYKRYYRKQRERILEKTTNELKLQELAAQKEIIELRNDSLNKDIEARNRELAISTINMIRKNTLLSSIKSELKNSYDEPEAVKKVINLVDESINAKEDWKFFEEAFNHADKDFFKKLKVLHPDLTPNDLRLCVYLRLNLSSKEIAPLLNISPRSVEIKRYRLRKKIDLERQTNLNDYFINL